MTAPTLDTTTAAFFADPYPDYARCRTDAPVLYDERLDVWMVFRHDDCQAVLRHPATTVAMRRAMRLRPEQQPLRMARMREAMAGGPFPRPSLSVYQSDPPAHTKRRRLLGAAFAAAGADRLRAVADREAATRLDELARRGRFDVMDDYAFPIHTAVIDALVGFDHDDEGRALVRTWSDQAARIADPDASAAVLREGFAATAALERHCAELIEARRRRPPPAPTDVASSLLAAQRDGAGLTDDEILDQVVLVYLAGLESTASLIGNAVHALFHDGAALERWRREPDLDAPAVDELLRFDSPVQFTRRVPTAPLAVGGHEIPAGSFVITWLGAANRDPDRWGPDVDRLVLDRPGTAGALSFGGGIHLCLGAALSRIEGQVALPALLRRFPRLAPVGATVWNERVMLRGVRSLPVATEG